MRFLSSIDTDLFLFLNGLHTDLDENTIKKIKKHLTKKVPHVFISSVAQQSIDELKDLIWMTLNKNDEGEDW